MLLAFGAAFALSLAAWTIMGSIYVRSLADKEIAELRSGLERVAGLLSSAVNRRQSILAGLESFIRVQDSPKSLARNFPLYAEGLKDNDPAIRAIQVFPPQGPCLVYPAETNKAVQGRTLDDLLADERPDVRADVGRAVKTGGITLSEPYELRQGGLGIVARLAINEGGKLWGVAVVVLDIEPLLRLSGIDAGSGAALELKDRSGRTFFGSRTADGSSSVQCAVPLPEGSWSLSAPLSAASRVHIQADLRLFLLSGLFFSLLAGAAAAMLSYLREAAARRLLEQEHQKREEDTRTLLEESERSRKALAGLAEDNALVQARLRKSEELLHEMGRIAVIGGWEFDAETGEGTATEAIGALYGIDSEAITNLEQVKDRHLPESRARMGKAIAGAVERGEPFDLELELAGDDGRRRWVRVIGNPILNASGRVAIRGSTQDISQSKAAMERLSESEEKFRLLFETISDTVIIYSLDGRILLVNKGARENLGYSEDELIGKSLAEVVSPRFSERVFARLEKIKARGELIFESEHLRKDGGIVSVEVRSRLIDLRGVPAVLSVSRDIGDRLRAEESIRAANESLERRVAERTAQLESANGELEAFAYSVSHDLRAPLRAVDSFSRFLQEDCAERLGDEGRRLLSVILRNTEKMDRLITDLLRLSRIGREELRVTLVDMFSLAAEACAEAAPPGQLDSFEVVLRPFPDAPGDPSLLRQVWLNLLSNAFKYSMKARRRYVEIGGIQDSGSVTYYVKDEGAGFDPEYADKLFGVFQRLHKDDEFEGNGVGLALVRRIVGRHGGKVWAEGRPGAGATFYFSIPSQESGSCAIP